MLWRWDGESSAEGRSGAEDGGSGRVLRNVGPRREEDGSFWG